MKRKAITLILCSLVLAAGLYAGGQGGSSAKGGQKTEIICMVRSSPEAQFLKNVAEAYMAEPGNENIIVTINELGRDNAYARIQNQLFTRSAGVDFFFITPSLVGALAEGGVLEDLSPYFSKSSAKGFKQTDFTPGGIESGTYKNVLYGVPFNTSTMLLFYRTDLISTPPQTWEEYESLARRFTRSVTPNSPTPYGTTVVGKPQQDAINLIEYSQVLWSRGGELVDTNNTILVNKPINVSTLDYWTGLFKNKLVPPDANTYDYTAIVTAFKEEQVAMCMQWDAAAGEFANPESSPKIQGKYAVSVIPGAKQPNGSILRKPYLNMWLAAINKFSVHKEETFDFFAYLFNKDVFIKHLTPSMTTGLNEVIASPEFKANRESTRSYEAYRQSLAEGRAYNAHRDLDTIKSILDSALNQALVGVLSDQQALDEAAKELAEKLQ
jgi:multiple sugar transport system substrate-binding protein